jgi:hypothetical protein
VGVEPTRDVYSPMLDLKSRGITGSLTLPWAELSYSVEQAASRTIDFPATRTKRKCAPYEYKVEYLSSEMVY